MTDSPVVIVGAGQAGCQAAVSLRELGHRGTITLVGDEGVLPYQRPPLTKAYLQGDIGVADLVFRPETYYAQHDISLVLDDPAVSVDRAARQVVLRSGRVLDYENLVLATGSRPRPIPGAHTIRTIGDADFARPRGRVVAIGAGFIGLEHAAVASEAECDVTVVEAQTRALSRVLSEHTAEHVVQVHRRRGVKFLFNATVSEVRPGEVVLADGTVLPADLVVAGIGVVPNVELAQEAGLTVDDGIVVDARLRTSDPAIFAIGDCARFPHGTRQIRLESVQNAVDQASCVAAVIRGSAEPYAQVPWFWSDQYAMKVQIAGLTDGHDNVVVTGDPTTGAFSVFCFRGDELLGVESVNKPVDHVLARRLLAANCPIRPEMVAVPGFDLRTAA
ncbi:NAD(P)/FAD-dependent oxidoreductase [Lentzea aerocolonigenes]|uniref:NAD(P)/FAD-dependent oxidoreductase n=1 Tax=Lentzea aerocolonigenes TaxID=68170 RepID=UPI0004C4647D|nr:FAD-dependent oxidoreductase [Lentzea aerocolonigenes]MCP2242914.1 3-phenylpropionate/trans-cinnamate dioxygenase ferredoxin reductase subunit [Lentzea aerocolonigenes]